MTIPTPPTPAVPPTHAAGGVVILSGGAGGAKLAHGLAMALPPWALSVIVNTGDDFRHYGSGHYGLAISPDVDTVLYTLGGLANPATGWGIAGDTDGVMRALAALGDEPWFHLGDRDLATHLFRSARLDAGETPSAITARLAGALGVNQHVLPMTDQSVATRIHTSAGELAFQDWFVRCRCEPAAQSVSYCGVETAQPTAQVTDAIRQARLIVLGPSNPYLSIGPILAIPGMLDLLREAAAPIVAVSPIVGGVAIKGPAAAMMRDLAGEATALAVARLYDGLADAFVIDTADADLATQIGALGIDVHLTDTIMGDDAGRRRLADAVLAFGGRLAAGRHSSTTIRSTVN